MAWCWDNLDVQITDVKDSGFIGSDYIAAGFLFEVSYACGVVKVVMCS